MAIAHDTSTRFPATDGPSGTNSVDTTTGTRTFSHAGSASAAGAVVVLCNTTTTATVTGVLYGGVAMSMQTFATDTSEAGRVEIWVLVGAATPTGTQTVSLQGCTATGKWATCSTVTVAAGKVAAVETADFINTSTSVDPQVALTVASTVMSYGGVHSGASAPPSVPLSGCTLLKQNDYGVLGSSTLRRTSVDTAGTVTIGYTLGSDDWCMAAVALAEAVAGDADAAYTFTGLAVTPRPAGPLSDADIVQSATGTFTTTTTFQDFPVTLPAAATYGNTVVVAVFYYHASAGLIFTPPEFVLDSPTSAAPSRMFVFRRTPVGYGESSWTFQQAASGIVNQWVALELTGLDAAPLDASSPMAAATSTTVSSALPLGSSYDAVQLAFFGARNTVDGTVPAWSGYTPIGFSEVAEVGNVDGTGAVSWALARQFPGSPAGVTAGATSSISGPLGAVSVAYASAAGRAASDVSAFWGFEQGTLAGATLGANPVFNATAGSPVVTASTPRTGTYCLELTAAAGTCNATRTSPFGTSRIGAVRVPLRFVGSLPAADTNLFSVETASGSVVVQFRTAADQLGVQIGSAAEVLSDAAVAADTWLAVEVQFDTRADANFRADWAVDYGDGVLVDQPQAFSAGFSAADITTLRLGWAVNATATVRMDDVAVLKAAHNYPIRDHIVQPLLVDVGALTTTADAKFQTFTANGTLVAWDGTVAQAAIDEIPPTVSASADGIAQVTSGASDYVTIPMGTYTPGGTGIIRAVRMLLAGWAASGTAATLGFRAYDGTTEMLLAAAADPAFDNSTTAAVWVSLPVRPASGSYTWTQAKLDALALRVGFGDAAVAVGLHAVLCEVLVQTSAAQGLFGAATTGDAYIAVDRDPVSDGILVLHATTPPGRGASVTYEVSGSPTTLTLGPEQTLDQTIDAPDGPTVNRLELHPDPEGIPDA